MINQSFVNKYLDEAIKKTDNRDTLIAWLIDEFSLTPEWANDQFEKWLGKAHEEKRVSLAKEYQMKLLDIQRDYEQNLIEAADWYSKLTQSPSHTD